MLILGLTGSIGMGKSTAAAHFRTREISVFDADGEVHRLYENEAVPLIEQAFPGTTGGDGVDRVKLSNALGGDPELFTKLEGLIHPLVFGAQRKFLEKAEAGGAKMVVLEIPLLYETGGEKKVDVVIVVSAEADQQRQRVLERPGMSEEKLAQILRRQIADNEKRARANYVVDTSGSIEQTYMQIDMIITSLSEQKGSVFDSFWIKAGSAGL